MSAIDTYMSQLSTLLETTWKTQSAPMEQAARRIADCLKKGGSVDGCGFELRQGGEAQRCTFEALVEGSRMALEGDVARVLFQE